MENNDTQNYVVGVHEKPSRKESGIQRTRGYT